MNNKNYNKCNNKIILFYNKDNKCMIYLDDKIKKLDKGEWWPGVAFGNSGKSYLQVSNVEKV